MKIIKPIIYFEGVLFFLSQQTVDLNYFEYPPFVRFTYNILVELLFINEFFVDRCHTVLTAGIPRRNYLYNFNQPTFFIRNYDLDIFQENEFFLRSFTFKLDRGGFAFYQLKQSRTSIIFH